MFAPARMFQPMTGGENLIERRRLRLRQSPPAQMAFLFSANFSLR